MWCCFYFLIALLPDQQLNYQAQSTQAERERALVRQQFDRNFREIQLLGQRLLREHEAKRLTPQRLIKDTRSINKCAKNLRSLIALGNLASEIKIDKEIDTPEKYTASIRQLAKLIWDFAHNPVHKNNKVFNTDQAARAQTDLLTIINLSKIIGDKAKGYVVLTAAVQ